MGRVAKGPTVAEVRAELAGLTTEVQEAIRGLVDLADRSRATLQRSDQVTHQETALRSRTDHRSVDDVMADVDEETGWFELGAAWQLLRAWIEWGDWHSDDDERPAVPEVTR